MKNWMLFLIALALAGCEQSGAPRTENDGDTSQPGLVRNIDVDEAEQLLRDREGLVVLDVRTPQEYAEGHIAGAKNIDFFDKENFRDQLARLDRDRAYLVHCAVGGRSAQTREMMKELQFESIYHLEGGFKAWEQAGKPVEK